MNKIPSEQDEQRALCKWLRLNNIPHFGVPSAQGMSQRAGRVAMARYINKLKLEGFSAGFPDMVIFLPNIVLFIEMKRQKGGTVSTVQKEWIKKINKTNACHACVCKGFDEAVKIINQYS